MLRRAMAEADLDPIEEDDLADIVLLLASELCDNATLHAGTEFEVELSITPEEVLVSVTDHGAGPLELYLAQPRPRFGRAATHGRGLLLIDQLASSWGTRHERNGGHRTWFQLLRAGAAIELDQPVLPSLAAEGADPLAEWPDTEQVRRLLRVPAALAGRLDMPALVTELTRRLREVLRADGVSVEVDHGDGTGAITLAQDGILPSLLSGAPIVEISLPITAPLRGTLRVLPAAGSNVVGDLAELTAQRIALAVETDWLRGADLRRRAWMAYLADASELFGQTMDVELVVALVPQVVVPRLGEWCAVYLLGETASRPRLAALTHASDDAIPHLRAALDPTPPAELAGQLRDLLAGSGAPAWFGEPTDGIAVGLTARARPIGALVVGRPAQRAHTPEDIALVGDIARRASLAIDNARNTAAHIATSQALQQALLPRALPKVPGLEFAAEYLPASTGSDVGGDFYDVLAIDDDRWVVSVGDVCGKGARAAARTGMVRDVLRVLVREGRTVTRAVELLNDVMMDVADPSQFCTLAIALVGRAAPDEPPGLTVELVLAGHPRPVLVHADGRTELVGSHGTAVGLTSSVRLAASTHHLRPGDTLLAYTDGVTERRAGREQFGQERLLAAAATAAGQPASRLIAAVRSAVEAFSRSPRRDDIALLAIRAGAT
jgi:phosphoserine phosphatase RsbU/P